MMRIQSIFRSSLVKMTIHTQNQTTTYHKVTHVIFDMDGLLLDTEKIYQRIINDMAASYGKSYSWDIKMKILGSTERKTCEIAVKDMGLPISVDDFHKQYTEESLKSLKHVELFKGAERLVRHFHNNNVPICVATSCHEDSVAVKISNHPEIFKLFLHKVCGSSDPDVKAGKPSPDILFVAAKRFKDNPEPKDCLVFEDAPKGCTAAKLAGMQVVMVPDSHCPEEQRKDATVVLKSLLDFKPEEFGLPPFPIED